MTAERSSVPSGHQTQRKNLLLLVSTVLVMLALLGLCEALARVLAPGDVVRHLEWERKILAEYKHYIVAKCDIRAKMDQYPDLKHVVVVGESSGEYIGEHLEHLVSKQEAQIHNCAIAGASLEDTERLAMEALEANPDELILVFGHNLTYMHHQDLLSYRIQEWRSRSVALSWLSYTISAEAVFDPGIRATNVEREDVLVDIFRTIARAAKQRNVGFTLTTMAPNHWWPPEDRQRNRQDHKFLDARLQRALGDEKKTLRLLHEGVKEHPESATWRFELATELVARGDVQAARPHFEAALRLDPYRGRATKTANARVRNLAAEEGLRLRDTDRIYGQRAPLGLVGWKSLKDYCHLRPDAYNTEAIALLGIIGIKPQPYTSPHPDQIVDVLRSKSGHLVADSNHMDHTVTILVWRSVVDDPTQIEPAVQQILLDKVDWPNDTQSRMVAAIANGYARAGKIERAAELAAPIVAPGHHIFARITGALVLLRAGRRAEALAVLKHASQTHPGHAEFLWMKAQEAMAY